MIERAGLTPTIRSLLGTPRSQPASPEEPQMLAMFVELQNWITDRKAQIDERGATAVEYALMVGLIAVAIIGAVSLLGNKIKGSFNTISGTLPG
jgi:pilus assembly protein Flp/PilA